jgi:hypothetical protein
MRGERGLILTIKIPQFIDEGSTGADQLAAVPGGDGAPEAEHLAAAPFVGPHHSARGRVGERGDGGADQAVQASPIHLQRKHALAYTTNQPRFLQW